MSSLPPPPPPPGYGTSPQPYWPQVPGPPNQRQAFPPQPFPPSQDIRPRTRWYWIAGVVGLAALVLGGLLIVRGIIEFADKIDDFQRVDVPGSQTIFLEEGSYTVYAESDGPGEPSRLFGANVSIRGPDEREIELRRYGSTVTYDVSDHDGIALYSFRADVTGEYRVTTTGSSGDLVAVGPGLGSGIVTSILSGLLVMLVGGVVALVTVIVVAVRRGRFRRAQFATQYHATPPPAPW